MLEPINLKKTHNNPKVVLDKQNNYFEISGRSIQENVFEFYDPIYNWLIKYSKNPNKKTKFILDFDYINSASTKQLIKILIALEKISQSDDDIIVIWKYEKDDELMEEKGDEIFSILNLPYVLLPY